MTLRWGPTRELSLEAGGAPRRPTRSRSCHSSSSRARAAERAQRLERLERVARALRERFEQQPRGARRVRWPRRLLERRRGLGLGRAASAVEQHAQQVAVVLAVDERLVALGDQREAIAAQALDQPQLPQRAVALQPRREHAPGELRELALTARARQRGAAQLVLERERGRRRPQRAPLAQRHRLHAAAVAGHEREARAHVRRELAEARRRAVEDQHPARVQRHAAALLELEQGCVGWAEAVSIAHVGRLASCTAYEARLCLSALDLVPSVPAAR